MKSRFLLIIFVLCLLGLGSRLNKSHAFLFWGEDKAKKELFVNEEILVERLYKSDHGVVSIRMAIHVPSFARTAKISTFFDELDPLAIKSITWLSVEPKRGKKPAQVFRVQPYKILKSVNRDIEQLGADSDLEKAYDRIADNKHIVGQTYLFSKQNIFGANTQRLTHFLEFNFANGLRKSIEITDDLYGEPGDILPIFGIKKKKSSPDLIP